MSTLAEVLGGALVLFSAPLIFAAETPVSLTTSAYRVVLEREGNGMHETFAIQTRHGWQVALEASPALRVVTPTGLTLCQITSAVSIPHGVLVRGSCDVGSFEQRLTESDSADVLDVSTRFEAREGAVLNSVEDRYAFVPKRNPEVDNYTGPLDFVWSQNIKSESDDLVASAEFKSPVIMMQQRELFAALMANPGDRHLETRALDLDVTSEASPWMSFGAIPFEPHGHSYFRRAASAQVPQIAHTVEYRYQIVLSEQEPRLGYRRAVRLLWQNLGHPALLQSGDEQRNVVRPELHAFDVWRTQAWTTEADRVYSAWPCGTTQCGTLASDRSVNGDWEHWSADAWFNPWFQTLRTAYGWYLHGRAAGDRGMQAKAESVLNLALSAPTRAGAFSTIYTVPDKRWIASDGWAGYQDSYDAFSMSWTAYWMLRWAQDLVPERKNEILSFAKRYGDFLLRQQKPSGVIPSWYLGTTLEPRSEFSDFNAETAPSAMYLATLSAATGEKQYQQAAEKAMAFVMREVVPRERWFDFETFLSCARKPYTFFDPWTAQFPQNNLAELQAPEAMLALYRLTGRRLYLDQGTQLLDYVLLTQQVWNNPQFTPMVLGGFTTQNTDAEWSDARQAYGARLLLDFYLATGTFEYLERAVAAARSTFAVAPWENWAHTGYLNEPGALTGFHWGTGSAMTSIEMMQPTLGDAMIDVTTARGVGFDECTVSDVEVAGGSIGFHLTSLNHERPFLVRFRGLQQDRSYRVRWNDHVPVLLAGRRLTERGLEIGNLTN